MDLEGKSFAIVGASNNPEKYGNKVTTALAKLSPYIYPINPKEKEILGFEAYAKVREVKKKIDFVVFVVPPEVTLLVLKEINGMKVHFWFQPGSFDKKVIAYCRENSLEFTNHKCIIVESEKIPQN